MRIISSSSDTFTVGIQIYDNSGYPVRWDSLGKVNVSFEVAGYQAAGHSFDPQSDRPEVELNASAFDGYPDGILYYNYIATKYDASMTEILAEYTGRAQTDFFIQLTAAGQGTTCATAVSELVNDAGYISGGELDTTLQSSFKTINGQSIIGSGNIEIQGGGSGGDEKDPLFTAWLDGNSVAAGLNAEAESPNGVAIGVFSRTYSGVAIHGTAARRLDTSGNVLSQGDGIAVGGNVYATGGVAVGKFANVPMNADRSVAIGQQSRVDRNAADSVAIGASARAKEPYSIVIGSDAVSHGENTLTIGCGVKSPEQIYLGDTTLKDAIGELSGGSITVDSELSADSTNPVQNKVVTGRINELAADIPTKTSQLANDSGYITEHQSLADYYTKEQTNNLIPVRTSQLANDSDYVNGADVDNRIDHKMPVNVSQLANDAGYLDRDDLNGSFKTINGESIIGSGDIAVTAGGSIAVDAELSADSTNPVQNKIITGRINELAAAIPTRMSQLANDSGYLTEHQSLENYYTKEQTDSSINAVKTAIPTKTSQLTNDSGYLTEHQSLADYYTKSQVDSSINAVKTAIPTKTSQLTNDSGYLTEHQSLADYYTKSQVDGSINAVKDAIPVNVSQLNNDSGYLTEHQSLDGYAKISAIPTKTSQLTNDSGYLTEHQSLAEYYTKSQVDSSINAVKDAIPVNVSQLTNDSGYLTEHQSLADYYTKEQTDSSINAVKNTIPKKTSQLTNDSGYLTEHQSLADYYTKSQTDAKIDEKISAAGPVNETDPVFTA